MVHCYNLGVRLTEAGAPPPPPPFPPVNRESSQNFIFTEIERNLITEHLTHGKGDDFSHINTNLYWEKKKLNNNWHQKNITK